MPTFLRRLLLCLLVVGVGLAALAYVLTWHPAPREALPVACSADTPPLRQGQAVKVMTWNLQALAGTRLTFAHDLTDRDDATHHLTPADLAYSLDEAARVIRDEQADVVLLQELQDGARASAYQDQATLLAERLADLYPCSTRAFYWKAAFVPDPAVLGSVGTQLVMLSRVRLDAAERLQLPEAGGLFGPKAALLLGHVGVQGGGRLALLTTHLDDGQGDATLPERQVAMVRSVLDELENRQQPWVLGGDLNQAPPPAVRRQGERDALEPLWNRYPLVPSRQASQVDSDGQWATRFPQPDGGSGETLDYLLHSPRLALLEARVRNADTRRIADHLPLVLRVLLPPAAP